MTPSESKFPILGTISRSAHQCFRGCPRQRFWQYEWNRGNPISLPGPEGTANFLIHIGGLQPQRMGAALLTGSSVHSGFEHLLRRVKSWEEIGQLIPWGAMRTSPAWWLVIEEAVGEGLREFDSTAQARGISFGLDPGDQEWYRAEQRALVEGLVWVAGLRLVPELVSRYKVLEVEREERLELGDGLRPFASRADALLQDRESGDLSVFSLKTGAVYGAREAMKFKRDVQGLSEAICIEERLRREHAAIEGTTPRAYTSHKNCGGEVESMGQIPVWNICKRCEMQGFTFEDTEILYSAPPPVPKVETVQMALLLKGIRRAQDEEKGGRKEHYSPLLRAWKLEDPIGGMDRWAWSWKQPKQNAKTGESYMGILGKDWKACSIWESYPGGVGEWVKALDRGEVQPEMGDPLMGCMALPEPWGRTQEEIEDWLEQLRAQELQVEEYGRVANEGLAEGDWEKVRGALNIGFPQNRANCVQFNSTCPCDSLCWGGGEIRVDPLGNGFVGRIDHHLEAESED